MKHHLLNDPSSEKELRDQPTQLVFSEDTIGQVLRRVRTKAGATLSEFSSTLGISAANLCDLEQGRRTPSPGRTVVIAQKLGLSESALLELVLRQLLRRDNLAYEVRIRSLSESLERDSR